jgi:FBP C-terminal treble-clef zinc-finger
MQPLSAPTIRESFVNVSHRERGSVTLPELGSIPWDAIDYLGWRDAKIPSLGYAIVELDDSPVGILLRQAEGNVRSRAQCSWCEDVQLPNDVVLFSARRAGAAGRSGNTIGTLVCANFECSRNVRKRPPMAYLGFDVDAARQKRIEALGEHVRDFIRDVRDGA